MKKLNYSLERRIPYLTNRLGSAINEIFSLDLAEEKLTIADWRVLSVLHDIGDQKLIELSIHTSIDASTLSRLTESMQRRRLVEKKRSKLSKREITVSLTNRGKELVEALTPKALEYEKIIVEGSSDQEVETMRKMLRLMYQRIVDFSASLPGRRSGQPAARSRTFLPKD
ncbi:MarR family winged helix-turn-helix transcriptional regulator [Bradyrhizobium mercantei]|uniref:MarR family winged helix-turn-helix transcriptional regulator n=1 Tax=Bradyrhizobium mercantei TaxID=1904807 RepID=UPI0009780A64|nr:MarR family transcriptional regulator [Bradyrhizobium mercantei]